MLKKIIYVFLSIALLIIPIGFYAPHITVAYADMRNEYTSGLKDDLDEKLEKWKGILEQDDIDELKKLLDDALVQKTTEEIETYLVELNRIIKSSLVSISSEYEIIKGFGNCKELTQEQCCILAEWEKTLVELQAKTRSFSECVKVIYLTARRTLVGLAKANQSVLEKQRGNVTVQAFFDVIASIANSCLTIISYKDDLLNIAKKDLKGTALKSALEIKAYLMGKMLDLMLEQLEFLRNSFTGEIVSELGGEILGYINKLIYVLGGVKEAMDDPKGEAIDSLITFVASTVITYITELIEVTYLRTENILQNSQNVLMINYYAIFRQILVYERVMQSADRVVVESGKMLSGIRGMLGRCPESLDCGGARMTVGGKSRGSGKEKCYQDYVEYLNSIRLRSFAPCGPDATSGLKETDEDKPEEIKEDKPEEIKDILPKQKDKDAVGGDAGGAVIVVECIQNRVIVKIYTASGALVGVVDRDLLKSGGDTMLYDMIRRADNGQVGGGSLQQPGSSPSSSNPGHIVALDQDAADADIKKIVDVIKESFEKNRNCKNFCDPVRDVPGVDFWEENYVRDAQEGEEPVVPNDPFYFDPSDHKGFDLNLKADSGKGSQDLGGAVGFSKSKDHVFHDQWGMHAVGFTPYNDSHSAWNQVDANKKNVVVAVIDSGFDVTHPDSPQYLWANAAEIPDNLKDDDGNGYIDDIHGWNFIDENNDLRDYKGHGTFVAGIIAARANNGIAIAGINPGAQIMVLKAGDKDGKATSANIYRALRYAADKGARVINISLGSLGISVLEQLGVDYAYNKGCIVVVAAGNQSGQILKYGPPALHKVISVAAAAPTLKRIWSSNIGANVSLTAPGVSIYSLYSADSEWTGPASQKKNLCYKADGTSFAAPFVAGTASLLLAKDPELANTDVEDILLDTSTDIEEEGWDQYTGAGFLNAYAALTNLQRPILTVRFMDIVINHKQKGIESVDIYGVIRGDGVRYYVELAKGTKSDKWAKVFESEKLTLQDGLICSIEGQKLQSNNQWSLRITAQDKNGKFKVAKMSFLLD